MQILKALVQRISIKTIDSNFLPTGEFCPPTVAFARSESPVGFIFSFLHYFFKHSETLVEVI